MPETVIGGQSNVGGGVTIYTSGGRAIRSGNPDSRYSSRRYGGGGGGNNQSSAATQYQSELLNQTFSSLEAKNQAESQFRQQQAQAEQVRQQDIRQQRSSITARNSGLVQLGKETPDAYKDEGIGSSVSAPQRTPFRQVVRELVTNPKSIIPTVQGVVSRNITNPIKNKIDAAARPFTSAQTRTERQFQSRTEQQIKSFESQVNNYSANVESFNKDVERYQNNFTGKELTPSEYAEGERLRATLSQREAQLEQTRGALQAREEVVKQQIEGYSGALAEARKKASLFERFSVSTTKGVGDVIGSAGFIVGAIGSPGETYRKIEAEAPKAIKDFGGSIAADPLGTGVQVGTGFVVGGVLSRFIGKTAEVVKAARTPTTLSVSVGEINAIKVPGTPNTYRVRGTATGQVRNLKGEVIGTTTTSTESITVTARTAEEATQSYSRGVATSLAQAGADTSKIRIGVTSIEGKADFTPSAVEGLVQGRGRYTTSEVMGGTSISKSGIVTAKLKRSAPEPSRAFLSESVERAAIDNGKIKTSLVDSKTLGVGELGLQISPLGLSKPFLKKTSASFERDVVNVLKENPQVYAGIPRFTYDITPTKSNFGRPRNKTTAVQETAQALDLTVKAVEQSGVQSTRVAATSATQDLQKQLKKQSIYNSFSRKSSGRSGQLIKQESRQIDKLLTGTAQIQRPRLRDRTIFNTLSLQSSLQGSALRSGQLQVPRLSSAQRSALGSSSFSPLSAFAPLPNPPRPGRGFFSFLLPSDKPGAGSQYINKLKRKTVKSTYGYSASLAAAAFQVKPFKVTRKQYERLSQRKYLGVESRPVLQIVDEKNLERSIKNAVQF